jgi:hypothetical protein
MDPLPFFVVGIICLTLGVLSEKCHRADAAPDCPPRIDYEPRGFVPVTHGRAVRERAWR